MTCQLGSAILDITVFRAKDIVEINTSSSHNANKMYLVNLQFDENNWEKSTE